MSALLFENPLPIGVTGAALTLIAVIVWVKGGFPAALYTAAGLCVLTVALVLLNLQITTDRERVDGVIRQVAAAVERNDLPAVLTHIHPAANVGLQRAKSEFPQYKFTDARVTSIKKIDVNPHTNPPSAVAEFFVSVSVTDHINSAQGIRRFVRAFFFREGDRWLVNDYEHFDPMVGFRNVPGDP